MTTSTFAEIKPVVTIPNLNPAELELMLLELKACYPARLWAKNKDLKTSWLTCNKPDWMFWLLGKQCGEINWPNEKHLVLAVCTLARAVLKYIDPREKELKIAIQLAEKWALGGDVTRAELVEISNSIMDNDYSNGYAAKTVAFCANAAYAAYVVSDPDIRTIAIQSTVDFVYSAVYTAIYASINTNTNIYTAECDLFRQLFTVV